jgi:hypothetical protein
VDKAWLGHYVADSDRESLSLECLQALGRRPRLPNPMIAPLATNRLAIASQGKGLGWEHETSLAHDQLARPSRISQELGIGRSLFDTAVSDIVTHRFRGAVLWVLDTNERARRFYEAAGWRPDGATKTEDRPGGKLQEVRYTRTFSASTTAN